MGANKEAARLMAAVLVILTSLLAALGIALTPEDAEILLGALLLIAGQVGGLEWVRKNVFSRKTVANLASEDGEEV